MILIPCAVLCAVWFMPRSWGARVRVLFRAVGNVLLCGPDRATHLDAAVQGPGRSEYAGEVRNDLQTLARTLILS